VSGAGDAGPLRALSRPQGADWQAFAALYSQTFPEWEREPLEQISARLGDGRYRAAGLWEGRALLGLHLRDDVSTPAYSVLTFVAVTDGHRGGGLGQRLVADAVAAHAARRPHRPLFVEAEATPQRLYRRAGFLPLALEYRVPHYRDAERTQAMALLVRMPAAETSLDGEYLRAVIEHQFIDGYRVAADDARLRMQLARVPKRVEFADDHGNPQGGGAVTCLTT
jgi:ribosomal protein S18 acetylase RimI-like enzyme